MSVFEICQVLFDWEPVKRFLVYTASRIENIDLCHPAFGTVQFVFLILGRKVTFPMGSFGAKTMKYTTILASKVLNGCHLFCVYPSTSEFTLKSLDIQLIPTQDLGHLAKDSPSSASPGCETIEGCTGQDCIGAYHGWSSCLLISYSCHC